MQSLGPQIPPRNPYPPCNVRSTVVLGNLKPRVALEPYSVKAHDETWRIRREENFDRSPFLCERGLHSDPMEISHIRLPQLWRNTLVAARTANIDRRHGETILLRNVGVWCERSTKEPEKSKKGIASSAQVIRRPLCTPSSGSCIRVSKRQAVESSRYQRLKLVLKRLQR